MVSLAESDDQLKEAIRRVKWLDTKHRDGLFELIDDDEDDKEHDSDPFTIYQPGCALIVIKLPFKAIREPLHHSCIAHESFHVVERIAYSVGLKPSPDSSEAYAYLLDYIVEQIYEKLKR